MQQYFIQNLSYPLLFYLTRFLVLMLLKSLTFHNHVNHATQ